MERVLDFHSAIRIGADGTLVVTERIQVQAEGRDIRRGILRDFPTDYRDRFGNRVKVPFSVLSVSRDGGSEPFALERMANGTRIRIGQANVFLNPGPHTYEILYRTGRQVGFFDEHDELYWNVNGNGWTFAFDHVSAEVGLPGKVPAASIRVEAYTGPQGAQGRDYLAFSGESSAAFRATRALAPYEGMTIVVSFPKGIVTAPSLAQRLGEFFHDNRGVLLGLFGLAILLAFLGWRWLLVGRDPRAGPKFPRYAAPPGIGPGAVRYVDKMGFDQRCIAAMLLGLGSRGGVKVRSHGGVYEVEATGKPVEYLPGERELAQMLYGPGKALAIGPGFDPRVQAATAAAAGAVQKHFGERLFSTNRGSIAAGFIIAVATLVVMDQYDAPQFAFFAAMFLMAGMLFVFWKIIPAYSVEGRRLQDAIEGLRQYLSVAEADELRRMKAPPQTKEEFAKFLPYAVALDVEQTWADRFAATLGAAAVSAAVADYYTSSSTSEFNSMSSFSDSLSGIGSTISSASTPPGSSSGSSGGSSGGGGGGGSSGGGGGGGGGSGW